MIELKAFSAENLPIGVIGGLKAEADRIYIRFELKDPKKLILDSLKPAIAKAWPRADELWKTTCFECFLGVPGEPGYWEFNLSPHAQRWALYRFENYRAPQPPAHSEDFSLENIQVTANSLSCELQMKISLRKLEAALTAVIRTAGGISYFALKHRPEKPDFHWREGFVLSLPLGT